MTTERENGLRKLAQMMNTRHRNPFPVTKALLDCFDVAITQPELDFLLKMGTEPLSYDKAAALSSMPEDTFRAFFENLATKGLVWPKGDLFVLPGIMLGWFEVFLAGGQETSERKEFARRVDRLFRSFGKMNTFPLRSLVNYKVRRFQPAQSIVAIQPPKERAARTIPVNESVQTGPVKIYPARTVQELIEKQADDSSIALVHCFCRQYHKMVDEPCKFGHPPESCMAIGALGGHAVRYGGGRHVSKAEGLAILHELQQKGAVHQVFHQNEDVQQPEIAICNCCWDCCGVFGSYNRGIIPLVLKSYFEAQLSDAAVCDACEICVGFCPVQAVSMKDGKSSIDGRKCIGCGQCELHCPEHAITLVPKERTVMLPLRKRSEARIPI